MAWGTTGLTEDSELKRVAAVRQYLYQQFPSSTIRDSYDPGRLAQVFRVELHSPPATYTLVISTEFLKDHPPSRSGSALSNWNVADHLRAAQEKEISVSSNGINVKKA